MIPDYRNSKSKLTALLVSGILLCNTGSGKDSSVDELVDLLRNQGRHYTTFLGGEQMNGWTENYIVEGVEYRANLREESNGKLSLEINIGNDYLKKEILIDEDIDGKVDKHYITVRKIEINDKVNEKYLDGIKKILDIMKKSKPIIFPADIDLHRLGYAGG